MTPIEAGANKYDFKKDGTAMPYSLGVFPAITMEGSDYFYTVTLELYLGESAATFDSDYGYTFGMGVCVDDGTANTALNCV